MQPPILTAMASSGADVLELDHRVPIAEAVSRVGAGVAIWGNLDPVAVLARGTAAQVRRASVDLLQAVDRCGHRRFVLSSGCTLAVETPPENLRAMLDAARHYARHFSSGKGTGPICAKHLRAVPANGPVPFSQRGNYVRKNLGILVHGAGWVSSQHIAAYKNNTASRIVAICDRSLDAAQSRAREQGLRDVAFFDDLDKALRHPGVDAVSICTPQHVHCRNVLAAAAAGKHMLIEKPAGISLDELRQMRDAVRAAGVITVVGFVLAMEPPVSHAQGHAGRQRLRPAVLRRGRLPQPQRQLVVGLE